MASSSGGRSAFEEVGVGGPEPGDARPPDQGGVVLASNVQALRASLREILTGHGIPVVAEVDSGSAAVSAVVRHEPSTAILAMELAGKLDLHQTLRVITRTAPKVPVLLLVMSKDARGERDATDAGASLVLEVSCPPSVLVESVRWLVCEGEGRSGA
jgi:DNA-binding NarL/FixJ family response regulator